MLQAPLFPWPWIPHSHLVTMATGTNLHTWEELTRRSLSSPQPLLDLNPSLSLVRFLTQWTTPTPGSGNRGTGRAITPSGGRKLEPSTYLCNICPQQTWRLAPFLVAGYGLQAAPDPTWGIRLVRGPPHLTKLHPWGFLPYTDSPRTRDFWIVRQEIPSPSTGSKWCADSLGAPTESFAMLCESSRDAWHLWCI